MIANTGEAPMHPSLTYELPAPSTAVVDRKQSCRAYPSSASSLSLDNTRTVRIRIGGEDFVDPSSIRLMFTIKNGADGVLRPVTGPFGVWQQAYLRSSGVEIDNIPYYNRWHQQMGYLNLKREDQLAVGIEGLGTNLLRDNGLYEIGDIAGQQAITCMHRLHFSLFNAGRLLPVKYAPLEIELSMVNNVTDWLDTATASSSGTFTLQNIQILYDAYTLDEAVLQSFYSALLKNKVMSVGTMGMYQIVQPLPAGASTFSFSSVRAFSRLAQIWLTFRGTGPRSSNFMCPGNLPGHTDVTNGGIQNEAVPTARLSIGSHNWPDPFPVTTAAEYYMLLTKALGYTPNLTRKCFEEDAFTIVWDLQRTPGDPTSAVSTRSGDLVRCDLSNLSNGATECWMTLISYNVIAIKESGVSVLS